MGVVIPRHRCMAQLRRFNRQISWITAPAGTGKSHLLRQATAEHAGTSILLRLEEEDADPGLFFQRLRNACDKVMELGDFPPFGPEDLFYLRRYTTRLFEQMQDRAGTAVLLAIDDLHHLTPAPGLVAALSSSVSGLSDQVSLMIASREAPPDPWARHVAEGRMAELAPDSLLMDAAEVVTLLRAHRDWKHGAGADVVAHLLAVTGGWPSGLGVLIELAKLRPERRKLFGRREAQDIVFESFSQQMFAAFSPDEQRQLMLVAAAPVLYPRILHDVLGREICLLLERLHRNNMLVTKDYAEGDEWEPLYRFHALLREFLRRQSKEKLSHGLRRDVCKRMARALLARGEGDAARELMVEAQDWDALARHLDDVAKDLFSMGRIRSLTRFLNALPDARRNGSANLRYWRGLCLQHTDPAECRRELGSAYQQFKAQGAQAETIKAWAAAVDAIWFEWEDCTRFDSYIDDLPRMHAMARDLGSPEITATLTKGAFAALSLRRPEYPNFAEWEAKNLTLFQRHLPRSETLQRGLQLMIHYVYCSGERRKAEIVLARLTQLYDPGSESAADICGYYVVNAAFQFWFSPDATLAPATVMTGLAVTESLGLPFWDVPLLNAGLFRLASDENLEGLRNFLAMLDQRLTPESREHDIAISHHFAAYVAWLEGDFEKAMIAIDASLRIAIDSGFSLSPIYYGIGRVAILVSLGRVGEALQQLRMARRRALDQDSRTMTFMAHMVGAALALRAGKQAAAMVYLRPALALGAAEGFCAALWLRGADRALLCDLALRQGVQADFARQFKQMFPGAVAKISRTRVCTLGRVDILREGRSALTTRKPQLMPLLLLLHLVAAGRRGRSGEELIDALWPDVDTKTGRRRLKTTLYRLRKLLDESEAISSKAGFIRLYGSRVDVDAWQVEDLIGSLNPDTESVELVVELYQGEFMDFYSGHPELVIYREYLIQKIESAVLQAGGVLMAQEDWDRAAALFESALRRFGHHGELLACLTRCLQRAGRGEARKRLKDGWISDNSG